MTGPRAQRIAETDTRQINPEQSNLLIDGVAVRALSKMPASCIDCVVTSPPYWGLRSYEINAGRLPSLETYIGDIVETMDEVARVLKHTGSAWINVGDTWTSTNRRSRGRDPRNPSRAMDVRPQAPKYMTAKNLLGIPWRLAFELQAHGWTVRQEIIWAKGNPQAETADDRPARSHETMFMLTQSRHYAYDDTEVRNEEGAPVRSVWWLATASAESRKRPKGNRHPAPMPIALAKKAIMLGSTYGDIVLDPYAGGGTTLSAAAELGRRYVGIEIKRQYADMAERELAQHASRSQAAHKHQVRRVAP